MSSSDVPLQRLHPSGVFFALLDAVPGVAVLLAPVFFAGEALSFLIGWQLTLVTGLVLFVFLRWLRFRYWIADGVLHVVDGALFRREIVLDRGRVEAVEVRSQFLQRVFRLARVQVKTAAAGTQVDFVALTRSEAERIRALLDPAADPTEDADTGAEGPPATDRRWSLSRRELVAIGLTSGRLGIVVSVLGGTIGTVYEEVMATIRVELASVIEALATVMPHGLGETVVMATSAGVVLVAVGVLGAFLYWGRFEVRRATERITVSRGLFERREVVVQATRVQGITVVERLLHLPFDRCAVYVETIGHSEDSGASTCLHPYLPKEDLHPFVEAMVPGLHVDLPLRRPPQRARSRFLVRPTLWIAAVALVSWGLGVPAWIPLLALPIAWWLALLAHRDTGFGVGARHIVVCSRGLGRKTGYLWRRCAQSAEEFANLFQRNRRVASVSVVAASGAFGRTYVARDLSQEASTALVDALARGGDSNARGPTGGDLTGSRNLRARHQSAQAST